MINNDDSQFDRATRKALFGHLNKAIPGKGTSATKSRRRHVRCKVTINIDGDLIDFFKQQAEDQGRSYQLLINDALRQYVEGSAPERLARAVGQILIEDSSFIQLLGERLATFESADIAPDEDDT